jgi:hypothetical protein
LFAQAFGVSRIPLRIESLRVAHQFIHPHPARQVRLLGEITDASQDGDGIRNRIDAENPHRASFSPQQAEDMPD